MENDRETFQFLNQHFDVDKAKEIVSDRSEPDNTINVSAWSKYLSPEPDPNEPLKIYMLTVGVNWDHVGTVDTSKPLIMAWFKGQKSKGIIIIDGYHRLAKARRDGLESLPVFVLSEEESAQVRL